jgi:hypothetical protein
LGGVAQFLAHVPQRAEQLDTLEDAVGMKILPLAEAQGNLGRQPQPRPQLLEYLFEVVAVYQHGPASREIGLANPAARPSAEVAKNQDAKRGVGFRRFQGRLAAGIDIDGGVSKRERFWHAILRL